MKNTRIKMLISVLLTFLLIVSASFAWFFANNDVTVDYGSTVQCLAGDSLEISVDKGETWHSTVSFSSVSPKIVDITGDGVNLYRPMVITENGDPQSFVKASQIDENGEGDYLEIELMLRSASTMNVYFSGESSITPKSTSTQQHNIYGTFSKDFIAGAVRVAVVEKDASGNEQLKMIWAPNAKYELSKTNGKYTFNANGTAEQNYYYYKSADNTTENLSKYTVSADQYASKQFVVDSTGGNINTSGNSPILTVLDTKINESDPVYTKTIYIRVWFEGTDREADQALSGGWANMVFKFNGMQKQTAEAEKLTKLNDIASFNGSFVGLEEGMVYSRNGRDWLEYTSASTFVAGATYYFKYPETETHFETGYVKVTLQ